MDLVDRFRYDALVAPVACSAVLCGVVEERVGVVAEKAQRI